MKSILAIRHAQAEERAASGSDFDRVLTHHGQRQAEALAERLQESGFTPHYCLSSAAARAKETAKILCQYLNIEGSNRDFQHDLYLASANQLLAALTQLQERVTTVLIIAHNPGISDLVGSLCPQFNPTMGTSECVHLRFHDESWTNLSTAHCIGLI